jgi:hypothetical protein
MDDIVKAALKKWPGVPHCYGWLALDARGDWYLRDDQAQHAGPFPQLKGSRIDHAKLKAFIERNYEADAAGRWFFQNGPQRVYVQLEAAPWIWRLQGTAPPAQPGEAGVPRVTSHTGRPALPRSVWLDDEGRLYLDTDIGFGIVHSQDMLEAAQAVEAGGWLPQPLAWADAPSRFGYQRDPAPD